MGRLALVAGIVLAAGAGIAWWVLAAPAVPPVPLPGDWTHVPDGVRASVEEAAAACRAQPENPAAFTELGLVYHGNAAPALAIEAYERALALGATDARTPYLLALLEEDWGRSAAAIEHLRLTVDREPDYAPAHDHLGRSLLELGEPQVAVVAFRRAVDLEPGSAEHHVGLGRALRGAGRLDEAEASFRNALAIDPDHAGARQLLGLTLKAQGRDQRADAHLSRLRRHSAQVVDDPWLAEAQARAASLDAKLDVARSYLQAGRLDSAVTLLERLAKAHPGRAEVFRRLGEAFARLDDAARAADAYERALEIEPHDAGTRGALAENLLLRGDLDGTEREVELALAADPGDLDAQVVGAAVLLRRGRAADAVTRLEAVTAQRGDHVAAHYWLGEALAALGRHAEAAAAFERVLELRPDLVAARRRLQRARGELDG